MHLQRELEFAIRLARDAGNVLLEYYALPPDVDYKAGSEPVTDADRAANALIVRSIAEAFPDDGILAEETPDTRERLAHDRVWVIDPMDGTKEFIKHNGEFSVMIGLAVDGAAELGVVYQPTEDRMFYAAPGVGSFLVHKGGEPVPLRVGEKTDPAAMYVAVSRSHRNEKIDLVLEALGVANEVKSGSVGLKVGLVCEQRCDFYIHPSPATKQWDTCAPEAVLKHAGGRMTDLEGNSFVYNRRDLYNRYGILATNGVAHDRILEQVRAAFAA